MSSLCVLLEQYRGLGSSQATFNRHGHFDRYRICPFTTAASLAVVLGRVSVILGLVGYARVLVAGLLGLRLGLLGDLGLLEDLHFYLLCYLVGGRRLRILLAARRGLCLLLTFFVRSL